MEPITDGPLLVRVDGTTAILTLNRPDTRNALDEETLARLGDAVAKAGEDPAIRAVVITGAGDRAFCAGADIRHMQSMDVAAGLEWARVGQSVFQQIEESPRPVIAAINGVALGGGCELALACDFRFMAETAQIGQPEIKLGLIPGWGGTQRLPRLVGPGLAKDLVLTGRLMTAKEAREVRLVHGVTPAGSALEQAVVYAAQFATLPPLAVGFAKRAMHVGADMGLREAIGVEAQFFGQCFGTEDRHEGLAAFLEKRPAKFEGR